MHFINGYIGCTNILLLVYLMFLILSFDLKFALNKLANSNSLKYKTF